jgi:hypothetical protein
MFPAIPAAMFASVDKGKLLNTIGLWLLVAFIGYFLFVREDPSKMNQETVDKLVLAVDKFSEASTNLSELAVTQRKWSIDLERQIAKQNALLETQSGKVYDNFNYSKEERNWSLDDLYASQLFQSAPSVGRSDVRRDEDGIGQAGNLPGAAQKRQVIINQHP